MKLDVEVLASTSIKRKKPWPQIVWAGQEKESLFLLDTGRISVLYVPSGKTKKKVPKLSPLADDIVHVIPTKNGLFLAGLLKSGDVFLWHKDRDLLKTVTGLANLISPNQFIQGRSKLCLSDDCSRILVVVSWSRIYIWQKDPNDSFGNPRSACLTGKWTQIKFPENIPVASPDCPETTVSSIFYSSQILGECCQCSITFNNRGKLCVTTLLLRFSQFHNVYKDSPPSVHCEWTCLQYSLKDVNTHCEPVNFKGAFVTCYSPDGQVIAIAANQKCPSDTSLLFVSPLTETVLVSELGGCGVQNADKKIGRCYWISSMAWTYDNLFLTCILRNGSIAVLSRLGEPITITTSGCSVDLGPSRFIPIHPVIRVQKEGMSEPVLDEHGEDPLQQVFSVSTHPSLPIILFTDGYMVTVIQIPDTSCMTFMRDLVLESSKHLKYIQEQEGIRSLTLASPYNLPTEKTDQDRRADRKQDKLRKKPRNSKNLHYTFEDFDGSLNETQDSEISAALDEHPAVLEAMQNLSSGKILFGEPEMMMATVDSTYLSMAEQEAVAKHLQTAKVALFMSWKLAASHSDAWTADLDTVAKNIVQNAVKLFELILDCPAVSNMMNPSNKSPSIQNAGLFQVIVMYRQLMDLLQFDIFQQHLIPVSLLLMHRTASLILESRGLDQTDPRLKTLTGCFTLLKFSEKTLNKIYVWQPQSVSSKAFTPRSGLGVTDQYQQGRVDGGGKSAASQQLSKKVSATWTLLYKKLLHFQTHRCEGESEYRQAQNLMCQIQENMQRLETPIPHQISPRVSQGDKHSLDGHHTQAVYAWSKQLQAIGAKEDSNMAARLLHSLLYTYLMRGELLTAVEFVDYLILRANLPRGAETDHMSKTSSSDSRLPLMTLVLDTLKTLAFDSPDMVPCIRDKSIRQVVQTMARFMAAYFTNQTVYTFPPANPQPLPAIHFEAAVVNNRIIPKYHEDITRVVTQHNLSSVWTVERTLEYLLLSGLVCEATWFADKMGDWKAAFMMSVGCVQHHTTAAKVYAKRRKPLSLPDDLSPANILQRKLQVLLGQRSSQSMSRSPQVKQDYVVIDEQTNTAQLTHTLGDILTAGLVGRVEVVPWLLTELVERLKMEVSQLSPLVPNDFYLPAPPLYCPQPSTTEQDSVRSAVGMEKFQRKKSASLIQLILCVLNSTHLSLPLVNWYVKELALIQQKARQFKANMEGPSTELPELLSQHLKYDVTLTKYEDTETVQLVLSAFRDFCSVLWMLHARDNLSQCLRKRQKYLDQLNFQGQDKMVGHQHKWHQECFTSLQWAAHLLSFSRFLPDEGCVYKVVLSLLLELPPSEDTADILAEYFYDQENLDAEVQEKLEKILNEWKTVILTPEDDGKSAKLVDGRKVTFEKESPSGKSLSVYFHKQCHIIGKVLKKKRLCFGNYDEFVFANHTDNMFDLNIGSRPYETKRFFIEFMDTFSSVSFGRLLEMELEKDLHKRYPVLLPWADVILKREMTSFLERVSHGQTKHSLVVMTPRDGSVESLLKARDTGSIYRRDILSSGAENEQQRLMKAKGLFRSRSAVEMGSPDKVPAPVRRYESQNVLDDLTETPSRQGSQQNLSELASRFYKSEDILYKQEETDQHFWSLNVNFGHRYMPLKNMLEWLEHWSKKPHSLGLGKHQHHIDLKPTIKIQVPSHLVLLSLWLLENKYCGKPETFHPAEREETKGYNRKSRSRRRLIDSGSFNNNANSSSPQGQIRKSSASPQGSSPLRDSLGVRTLSPQSRGGEELKSSAVLEEENVRSYYEQILEGPDDSSSLGVSSLASDELDGEQRQTLSIIRGTGSPQRQGSVSLLNRTIQLPAEALAQPLHSSSPLNTKESKGTSLRGSSRGRGRGSSRSPNSTTRSRSSRKSSQEIETPGQNGGSVLNGDIASQLQNIVRSEMRRIMEVQHKSLMAMMGAIDGPDAESHPIIPQQNAPSFQGQERSLTVDDLHQSRQTLSRYQPIHGALRELRNLQTSTEHSSVHRNISPGKENTQPLGTSDLRHPGDPSFPKFLRIPPERDQSAVKLPHIPVQAWDKQESQVGGGTSQIPLLRLDGGHAAPGFFQGLHQSVPGQFPLHPPPYDSAASWFSLIPPPQGQKGQVGMPLLRLPKQTSFGQMVPPEFVIGHQQEVSQRELDKQRHLQEFHRQYMEEHMERDNKRFGERLLRLDFRTPSIGKDVRKSPQRIRRLKYPPEKPAAQSVAHAARSLERDVRSSGEKEEVEEKKEEGETEKSVEPNQEEEDTEEEAEESGQEIDDGYAIRPGAFEAYLHLGQALGVANMDTNAQFQYQLAMKIQEQQRSRKKKVDFATMTRELVDGEMLTDPAMEVVRTAEAATSITKDTGVDPIQEALIEYNQARQGTVVPPDIFLGLRFRDNEPQLGAEGAPVEQGPGRSYLSVVDVKASHLLQDLSERTEERIQPDVSLKPSSISVSAARRMGQDMDAAEERLREGLEPPRQYRHDAVTVKMFETRQAGEDKISVALMPREGIRESKVAMIRRLREMNEQMKAIDEMSQNMESDFMNTHMLINTLEAMADAAHPSGPSSRSRSVSPVRVSEEERLSGKMTPKSSEKSPQPSARSKRSARSSADTSHMSGLSGISDIIGEVIAGGGVDLEEAGISTTEAERLLQKADSRTDEERLRMSVEKLQQIVSQANANADKSRRDPERRREIQNWMAEKFSERQREYMRQRAELRERESSPYKAGPFTTEVTLKGRALQDADKDRMSTRKYLEKANMDRRFEEAELLLGDILVDKPKIPKEEPSPKVKRKVSPKRTSTFSPKLTRKIPSARAASKLPKPKVAGASPTLSRSRNLGQTKVIQTDWKRTPSPDSPTRKGILKTSDNFEERTRHREDALVFSDEIGMEPESDYDRTGGSTEDLLSYARHVEEMDASPVPFERYKSVSKQEPKEEVKKAPAKAYKPKPFHEIVRLQRPEILRKGPVKRSGPTYVERPSSISRQNTARESSREEKERLYGTKHIPGTARKQDTGPRRVKTYAERLQEMKPKTQYSSPIVPRQHVPESVRSRSTGWQSTYRKATTRGPPHKPQTYVEQLKKINAGAPRTFKGGKTVTVQPRTYMKARKPAHPARSYVEQLQTINAEAPETLRRQAARSRRYPSERGSARPRPYGTPYRSMEEDIAEGWEARSEVSDWVVDDDVRNLIYGDDDTSVVYTVGGTASAMDYPLSEGKSDYYDYVMGEEDHIYAHSVDVDEIRHIADAASVSSGSVLSVIDWDAVDRLIEDVN